MLCKSNNHWSLNLQQLCTLFHTTSSYGKHVGLTEILWVKSQFAMLSVFHVSVSMCHTGTHLPNSVCYTITSSLCQMFLSFTELARASVCSPFIAQSFLLLGRCSWSTFCSAAVLCDIGTQAIPDSTDFYPAAMKERQYIPKSGHGIKFWCLLYQDIASFDSLTHRLDTMPEVKLHVAINSDMLSRLFLHFQFFILHTFRCRATMWQNRDKYTDRVEHRIPTVQKETIEFAQTFRQSILPSPLPLPFTTFKKYLEECCKHHCIQHDAGSAGKWDWTCACIITQGTTSKSNTCFTSTFLSLCKSVAKYPVIFHRAIG